MRVLHNMLMMVLGLVVLWSLVGISIKQIGEQTYYSFFIKPTPAWQLVYR